MADKSNPIVEEQSIALAAKFPGSTVRPLPNGSHEVRIQNMRVAGPFDREVVEVRFLAPVGFPCACPQNFWVYPDLRKKNGLSPFATSGGIGRWSSPQPDDVDFGELGAGRSPAMPGSPGYHGVYFFVSVQSWWPNRDTLRTFAHVIEDRLRREPNA